MVKARNISASAGIQKKMQNIYDVFDRSENPDEYGSFIQ